MKVAFITGGSSGIGRAVVSNLVEITFALEYSILKVPL
jgi:NAD(P)-dependent dehydrogenase (short-subunit alcohol dehydrogenase family)